MMLAQIVVSRGSSGWIVITFDDKVTLDRVLCETKEQLLELLTEAVDQLVQVELLKDQTR